MASIYDKYGKGNLREKQMPKSNENTSLWYDGEQIKQDLAAMLIAA